MCVCVCSCGQSHRRRLACRRRSRSSGERWMLARLCLGRTTRTRWSRWATWRAIAAPCRRNCCLRRRRSIGRIASVSLLGVVSDRRWLLLACVFAAVTPCGTLTFPNPVGRCPLAFPGTGHPGSRMIGRVGLGLRLASSKMITRQALTACRICPKPVPRQGGGGDVEVLEDWRLDSCFEAVLRKSSPEQFRRDVRTSGGRVRRNVTDTAQIWSNSAGWRLGAAPNSSRTSCSDFGALSGPLAIGRCGGESPSCSSLFLLPCPGEVFELLLDQL